MIYIKIIIIIKKIQSSILKQKLEDIALNWVLQKEVHRCGTYTKMEHNPNYNQPSPLVHHKNKGTRPIINHQIVPYTKKKRT